MQNMADHQKFHPVRVDLKARPAVLPLVPTPPPPPLLPGLSNNSKKGNHPLLQQQQQLQVQQRPTPLMISRSNTNDNIPLIQSVYHPPNYNNKQSSCCCKCICWTISLLVLLFIIVGVTGVILYFVFQPKLPQYSVDSLKISDLTLNFDLSLNAKFEVKITAVNPNKKIGIYYKRGSRLSVWYSNTQLCQGSLPIFYQGHRNTTVLQHVALTGQTQYASTLMAALQQQQQTGRIPLDLKVDVPVSIKLGKLKLRKVRILGTCLLIVDSLSANNLISIKASSCKFRLKL